MNETITLRNSPKLDIRLQKDMFEIVDQITPNNNGSYNYDSLKAVRLKKGWLLTLLSYIPFFWTVPFEPAFRNRTHLNVKLAEKTLRIWLVGSDLYKAASVKRELNMKKV
ncbi:hypothetical protein H4O18_15085 [Arenibacter sp. BSSL-BM3]|uniref:Uncharacterized protein n=1 Tax=Arenibacter arenosicollis TaxID=2762274 RepID=A0ABR7QQU5_9FLAO|nr:hypothetical protein [Arenibacter arenosicollis]MBC8769320.1 hypothetical protein [Arenibacter arenosicollis]